MIKATIGAFAVTAMLAMPSVQAATLMNRDTAAHRIVVVEGDARKEIDVQSAQEVGGLCAVSCSIYIGTDPVPYDLSGQDKVEIQGGELFYKEESEQGSGKQ